MNSRSSAVPSDWQVKTLGELAAQVTSGSRGWAAHYADHGSLFVRITNLDRSSIHLDLSNSRFVQIDPNDAEARRTRLAIGDILVSITADIGIIGYIDDQVPMPAYVNQHIARVRLDPRLVDSRFVAYYLASWEPQRRFVGATDTGAKAGMNLSTVSALSTVVPPLAEQSRIADALTDIDNLIATVERILAKKEAIKQGVTQELLSGRGKGWRSSSVGEEFHVQLGKRLDAAVNRGVLKECINNRAVRWGRVLVSESVLAPLSYADIRDLRLTAGDVLVCEGGEIGRASVWNAEIPEAYFLNTLHRLRSKGRYEPRLLVAFLERLANTGELSALAGKSSLAHLTKENLLRVRIPVPPLAEQKRIVASLLVQDQQITALERMLVKNQAIRQGMMQQLLTGRTRLPGKEDLA
ncbi:restriction endonuclease subunit S [Nocardia sp. BSTN01]|uniref:restriction endonuclease subunit S n=1 Tax=Nocardia sp. BSTN01 TaxID=2783665 RepID=UPI00188DCAD0|nr:restriction endonuclease subunit S [Nocardia sp. BSTN01]MBF4996659.1 restriction endonuclease subunit S [Nocardia sp. BSTN01]